MNESDFMPKRAYNTMKSKTLLKGVENTWGLPVTTVSKETLKGNGFDTVVFDLLDANINSLEKVYSAYAQKGVLSSPNGTDLIQANRGEQAIQTLKDFKKALLTVCSTANCGN